MWYSLVQLYTYINIYTRNTIDLILYHQFYAKYIIFIYFYSNYKYQRNRPRNRIIFFKCSEFVYNIEYLHLNKHIWPLFAF